MPESAAETQPNVVIVITDDQGYGDLACHGNPVIRTPHLDKMHRESVRFTNFHVGPTCAPTRAGLMTGRYCNSTGVWHTIGGRSLLRKDELTMADVFRAAGYRTGMFGKWHLGDNYPFRPHDRGFQEALYHGGGGVGQTPDHWGNDYFDDTYHRQGVPQSFEGYCTDVWFDQAIKFIEQNKKRPFFCYLPTNAPHSPFHVDESYSRLYSGAVPGYRSDFYGMITNIDENMGRLRKKLAELEIEQNTILIFMTDNGTSAGCEVDADGFVTDGFNAGMRGTKGSEYEGGHRVVFFLHWPGGGLSEGRNITRLTANIDILPTLAELCGADLPDPRRLHGSSLVPLLRSEEQAWPDRAIVTDSQRVECPIKWRQSATMTEQWRLINGQELYDIEADPGQEHDVAARHPHVVARLREEYEKWWELVSRRFGDDPAIIIGSDQEAQTRITCHDWHNEESGTAWNQEQIRQGKPCNGHWIIEVATPGTYRFELRRWPREEDLPMRAGLPGGQINWYHGGKALSLRRARVRIGDSEQSTDIGPEQRAVLFDFRLGLGRSCLQTWLTDAEGNDIGA